MEERIIDRIRKLLALTEARGATPDEAALAAAKAQALLFEHNLTMAQVEHTGVKSKDPYGKTDTVLNCTRFSVSWHRALMTGIASSNFCKAIYDQGAKCYIVGRPCDVEVVRYLYDYLNREIIRLARETRLREGVIDNPKRWQVSFCYGAAATVSKRLKDTQTSQAAATPASQALVVVSAADLARAVSGYFPRLRNIRGGRISNSDGYYHWQAAGRTININPGLSGHRRAAVLGLN